jgi:hypothetical protein
MLQSATARDDGMSRQADAEDVVGEVANHLVEFVVDEQRLQLVTTRDGLDLAGREAGVEKYDLDTEHAAGDDAFDHGSVIAGQNSYRAPRANSGCGEPCCYPMRSQVDLCERASTAIVDHGNFVR